MNSEFHIRSRCVDVLTEITRRLGTIHGRVRIQKTMYLLKRLGLPELEDVGFVYHHYGPFSSMVAGALTDAVHWRILTENAESFDDDRQKYEYRLGSEADTDTEKIDTCSQELVERVATHVRGEHWRTLELAATIDFLEQVERLSRVEACRRAIRLKPACTDYQAQALALLTALALPAQSSPPAREG